MNMVEKGGLSLSPKASLTEVCLEVVGKINEAKENSEAQLTIFKTFLTLFDIGDFSLDAKNAPEIFAAKGETEQDIDVIIGVVNNVISNLAERKVTEDEFYKNLLDRLQDHGFLQNELRQAIFLQCVWLDNRIPYYQLGEGRHIGNNEEFKRIYKEIEPSINKGRYIINAKLQYKTHRASLLMDIADSLDTNEQRMVFWASIIDGMRMTIRYLHKSLDEKNTRSEKA